VLLLPRADDGWIFDAWIQNEPALKKDQSTTDKALNRAKNTVRNKVSVGLWKQFAGREEI